ncbi:hypothetical protein WR25_21473 [Diploscapter pachys]|uniref:Uncharacterized protein n=1 Tax=Diploscapter pachys TaxID=2018661 RepID=A0A2A2JES9_9BILA|nr:hypothetical protein WR25_21473 [Diploscapter pachys]
MVKCLSDNTGHGPASCPAHHLHRYDGVHIDTYNHVHVHINVHIDAHIDVHIQFVDIHNEHIHYYYYNNNYNNRSLLRKFSSISSMW